LKQIVVKSGPVALKGVLSGGAAAEAIAGILPVEGVVQLWGEEIYFSIPLELGIEPDARQDMEIGEIAYWPDGPALCIFFGPTPASRGGRPRAYSPVNVVGRLTGDPSPLRSIPAGAGIVVEEG
jgi:hypothetical protein